MSRNYLGLSESERGMLSNFKDDQSLSEEERIEKLKQYLGSLTYWPSRKSSIQIVADWALEKNFSPSTYMGGRRSGRNHTRSKKTRRHKVKQAKRKMTRSKK